MKKLRASAFLCFAVLTLLCILRPSFLLEWLGRLQLRQPSLQHPFDWLAHACAFGAFTVFINLFLDELGLWTAKPFRWKLMLILIAFAALDEITQMNAQGLQAAFKTIGLDRPFRDGSTGDWLADVIGIASATGALAGLKLRRDRNTKPAEENAENDPAASANCEESFCKKASESDNEPATLR